MSFQIITVTLAAIANPEMVMAHITAFMPVFLVAAAVHCGNYRNNIGGPGRGHGRPEPSGAEPQQWYMLTQS